MTAVLIAVALCASPVLAHGGHGHDGLHMHAGGNESDAGGGHHGRGGNNAYAKAKVEERDRLLSKLKGICRGC